MSIFSLISHGTFIPFIKMSHSDVWEIQQLPDIGLFSGELCKTPKSFPNSHNAEVMGC